MNQYYYDKAKKGSFDVDLSSNKGSGRDSDESIKPSVGPYLEPRDSSN